MEDIIKNKVADSGIITIDLETFLPKLEIVIFDIKDYLFRGLLLKEKEFRENLKNIDWNIYKNKNVAITCSNDAIVPLWAYMLVTSYLQPIANYIAAENEEGLTKRILLYNLSKINVEDYNGAKVVVKGCGDTPVGEYAYTEIARMLLPHVKSLMYGEPCSTVPVYKRKSAEV